MLGRAPQYVAAALMLTLAATAAAQRSENARLVHLPAPALASVIGARALTGNSPTVPAESEAKSPVAAGLLSFFVPGVGSFYAGNDKHGFVHLSIHVGFAIMSTTLCGQGKDAPCGGASDAAVLVALVNWPWAIVNAVRDARASGDGASHRSQK